MIGNPFPLKQNSGKSFQGSIVLGKGFVLSPEEAEALIAKDPRNKEVLFPYLNGDDLNNDPEQKPSRWVINFFDWSEEKARTYPDCFEILEKRVKPERQRWKIDEKGKEVTGTYALRKPLPQKWWIYGEKRPTLYETISQLDQVMVSCRVSKYVNHSFIENKYVFDVTTNVLARSSYFYFSFLQSGIHEQWAWKYASTLESRIRYLNVDCIDTFPFPCALSAKEEAEIIKIGREFYELRAQIMSRGRIGLTKLYNQFHNVLLVDLFESIQNISSKKEPPRETSAFIKNLEKKKSTFSSEIYSDILTLRQLQKNLDQVIIEAYRWNDIQLKHDFYDLEYLPEVDRTRFTIHANARKEILARLLEFNHKLHINGKDNIDSIRLSQLAQNNQEAYPTLFDQS